MPSTSERLRSLVEGLYAATRNGNLSWEVTSDDRTFKTQISNNRIEVNIEPGGNGSDDIRVTVYNSSGVQVDSFVDTYFNRMKPANADFDGYFSLMLSLYESARRNATGADRVLDEIIRSLGTPIVSDDVPF